MKKYDIYSYPIETRCVKFGSTEGQRVTYGPISQSVGVPTWVFALTIGMAIGIIGGPAIIAGTDIGSRRLGKKVRER